MSQLDNSAEPEPEFKIAPPLETVEDTYSEDLKIFQRELGRKISEESQLLEDLKTLDSKGILKKGLKKTSELSMSFAALSLLGIPIPTGISGQVYNKSVEKGGESILNIIKDKFQFKNPKYETTILSLICLF